MNKETEKEIKKKKRLSKLREEDELDVRG